MTKKRRKKAAGCYPQCHYAYSKEFVDYDYVDALSDEEAEWLATFSDNYYSGRFRKDKSKDILQERKEGYNRARRQRYDLMSGRSKSRLQLSKKQVMYLEEVDYEEFKKYIENHQNIEADDE
jgi:hypothetical protein